VRGSVVRRIGHSLVGIGLAGIGWTAPSNAAYAGELGHFVPGVTAAREFEVPPSGLYYQQYNVHYQSNTFRDRKGKSVDEVTLGDTRVRIDADVDVTTIVSAFLWSGEGDLAGARYGAIFAPSIGSSSVSAQLSARNLAIESDDNQIGLGDLYVQPLWLTWSSELYSLTLSYGVTVPIGKYDEDDSDNIGLGFWSHQVQTTGVLYPFRNPATALQFTATYEFNQNKRGVDIRPGQYLGIEYALSQYLSERFEIGLFGYGLFQTTDDGGSDATRSNVHTQVQGVGAHIGYWLFPERLFVSGRIADEYKAEGRFEGTLFSIGLTGIF